MNLVENDPIIPSQTVCAVSFIPPKHDIQEEFDESIWVKINTAINGTKEKIHNYLMKSSEDDVSKQSSSIVQLISGEISPLLLELKKDRAELLRKSRGAVKVRGCYASEDEAKAAITKLQKLDNRFNIYMGQVGAFLPFNPPNETIENTKYQNEQLDNLITEYEKSRVGANQFFNERKQESIEDMFKQNYIKSKSETETNNNDVDNNEINKDSLKNDNNKKSFSGYDETKDVE